MEYMKTIKQRLFYDTLGTEVGDYTILQLARGLAGDSATLNKRVLFYIGETDCGKGVLTTAIVNSCGDYIGSFNAESLAHTNSSSDEAQKLRWALLVANKRIIISNEINNTVVLNGNLIKKISSGGDPIIGRQHNSNETPFYTHFLPILFSNDINKILPYDKAVDNRARFILFKKHFVDEPTNEFELKKDDGIKAECATLLFQRCFVAMLLIAYNDYIVGGRNDVEPDDVVVAKELFVGTERSNVIDKFLQDYEITNDESDYLRSSDIEEWINSNKLGISPKKWAIEMTKHCQMKKYDKVENKVKKVGKKGVRCWVGIKRIVETGEEEA